jgi:hypothetical protein
MVNRGVGYGVMWPARVNQKKRDGELRGKQFGRI